MSTDKVVWVIHYYNEVVYSMDEGIKQCGMHSGLLGFWASPIIQYSKEHIITLYLELDLFPALDEGVGHLTCWVCEKELTSITGLCSSDWG
jgi:hypothetical protein